MVNSSSKVLYPASVLSEGELQELTMIKDHVAIIHILTRVVINISLIFFMIYFSHEDLNLILLGIWFVYAAQFHFWGFAGIGHEFLHRRVFSSKILNDIFYNLCSSLTWNNSAMFRDAHMLHHRDSFSDKDVEAHSVTNWSFIYVLEYFLIDVRTLCRRLYYVMINSFGFYPNFSPLRPDFTRSARHTLVINLVLYFSLYFIFRDPLVTVLALIAPFSFSAFNKILAKSQHHELSKFSRDGALIFSRTLTLPKFICFLYANMNFHAEHHFAPSVPFYNLPHLHEILKDKGLVSAQSFLSFFNGEFQTVWLKASQHNEASNA